MDVPRLITIQDKSGHERIDLEISASSLALVVYVYPMIMVLILFRWIAIRSYRRVYGVSSPSEYSRLASLGNNLANSRSLKFSIIYVVMLCVVVLLTLATSFDAWYNYSLPWVGPRRTPVATLLTLPTLFLFLCTGILFVTMTSRGLSWWDARVISFRFYGSRGPTSYMKREIHSLIEENNTGFETYRAFLTIERLFKHEFLAGRVAREMIEKADPELYQELESSLIDARTQQPVSRMILAGSIILLVLSIFFLTLEVLIDTSLARSGILADSFFTLFLVFLLIWMLGNSLELPTLTPAQYLKLKESAARQGDSQ